MHKQVIDTDAIPVQGSRKEEQRVVIGTGTFAQRLSEAPGLSARHTDMMVALLRAESARLGQLVKDETYHAYVAAKETVDAVRARATTIASRLREAEQRGLGSWGVDLSVGCLALVGFGISVVAEYVLNRAVVPWLLSVSARSLLGQALSLGPAIAPIVLDLVLRVLFNVDEAWENAVSLGPTRSTTGRRVARGCLFAVVGALTLSALWLLADARAVASVLKNSPTLIRMTPLQQQSVDTTIRVLTVAIAVNAAIFYLFGIHELRRSLAHRRAVRDTARLQHEQRRVEEECRVAATECTRREKEWSDVEVTARLETERHFADGMAQLEAVLAQRPARSWVEVVNHRLNSGAQPAPVH